MERITVIAHALACYNNEQFRNTVAHPQAYDWEVACNGYKRSLAKWTWDQAYSYAREHAAKQGEMK